MTHGHLFAGQYRIASTRLKNWDYSSIGYYSVTICTKNKQPFFGNIEEIEKEPGAAIRLSSIGTIVEKLWLQIPMWYPNVSLDEKQIMPNHIHGVLFIEEQVKYVTLGLVINQLKAECTKEIRSNGMQNFAWQPRFHDHIIRNEKDLERVRQYIRENPAALLFGEDED